MKENESLSSPERRKARQNRMYRMFWFLGICDGVDLLSSSSACACAMDLTMTFHVCTRRLDGGVRMCGMSALTVQVKGGPEEPVDLTNVQNLP